MAKLFAVHTALSSAMSAAQIMPTPILRNPTKIKKIVNTVEGRRRSEALAEYSPLRLLLRRLQSFQQNCSPVDELMEK